MAFVIVNHPEDCPPNHLLGLRRLRLQVVDLAVSPCPGGSHGQMAASAHPMILRLDLGGRVMKDEYSLGDYLLNSKMFESEDPVIFLLEMFNIKDQVDIQLTLMNNQTTNSFPMDISLPVHHMRAIIEKPFGMQKIYKLYSS